MSGVLQPHHGDNGGGKRKGLGEVGRRRPPISSGGQTAGRATRPRHPRPLACSHLQQGGKGQASKRIRGAGAAAADENCETGGGPSTRTNLLVEELLERDTQPFASLRAAPLDQK